MNSILLLTAALLMHGQAKTTPTGPRRLVAVDSFTIKCTSVSSGSGPNGLSIGGSIGNTSGSGSGTLPEPVEIVDPAAFGDGLAEVLKSALSEEKAWTVLDLPTVLPQDKLGTVEPDPNELKPQFLIRATAIDMNVSTSSGGINIGSIGGGQGAVKNKVVLDIKLVDSGTKVVLETVRAVGTKTSSKNFLGLYDKDDRKVFGWEAFLESPLAEAASLAVKDGVKKLAAKLAKYPWEADVASIATENGKEAIYLNVDKESGLTLGQELEAFIPGEPIKDKKTGVVIGRARDKVIGRVKVVDVSSDLIVVEALNEIKVETGMKVRIPKA